MGSLAFWERHRAFLWLLTAVTLARLLYLALFPHSLIGDEAYYWDWGRHLDWGYYSKPPFIGWLMALADFVGGGSAFGIRIFAVLFGTGSLVTLYALGCRLYRPGVGFWAAAASLASPGTASLSLLLTIDAPLVFFWSVALYAFWRLVEAGGRTIAWSLVLLLALGLGHLTKQMMWLFPLIGLLFILAQSPTRPLLRRPLLWGAFLGSYLFLTPPILWNLRHGWVTAEHTRHHFESAAQGLLDHLASFGGFLVSQLGALSPFVAALMVVVLYGTGRLLRYLSLQERFLWLFCAPALAVFLLLSLRQEVFPNWPAVYYGPAFLLIAAWHCELLSLRGLDRLRNWFLPSLAVGYGLVLAVYASPFVLNFFELGGTRYDFFTRLRGWKELAAEVQEVRAQLPPSAHLVIVGHRDNVSQLAFHLPDQPVVYHYTESGRIESQYQVWGGPGPELAGTDALILVVGVDLPVPEKLASQFRTVEEYGQLTVPRGPNRTRDYAVFVGRSWQPPPQNP